MLRVRKATMTEKASAAKTSKPPGYTHIIQPENAQVVKSRVAGVNNAGALKFKQSSAEIARLDELSRASH
jgi:hypothetical protein